MDQTEQKMLAARYAIDSLIESGSIFSGMKIGLGTGSTAMVAVKRLAECIADGGLAGIRAVSTSFQTTLACEDYGIPVYSLNSKEISGELDLTIDGADEISPEKFLVKGGGAALLLEKIAAYNSGSYVIIADESKIVHSLGTSFPLPVEIVPEARTSVIRALMATGASVVLREAVKKAGPVVTDNGNFIIDCKWKEPVNPAEFENFINSIVGVVENGFFTKKIPAVYMADREGSVKKY
ncbi:ribose-5-phosphate isomerase RpiA [Brucepastera parasyntrophica]|uniref:ribose-5-phosphate isomerase RpiA n=1 Tax=Brucepastera parasyntrophica TaxID=2880008 RepID=UPI00210B5A31|nr:ribose-5-phosphate isomerase RpiA [Brucepastera parasyntrophica]ULQ61149.1 ribose-5-phosphate isomerase RpiA [Brucepastera parasyntrophica]